ncbi:Ger(x)C family spore germination protein [Paenibacillus athensensis]|uniref:Ger(x)C family spore germination protein n=1 Tax=Paenibacillus athensensis TaxID=1967502 RepID=UPI00143109F9|nr:Ger(x)C family spore germination protein [Paenibacillus athensensis]MCD1257424.1 Ger(x)C family spore germination protein [Paenibacillus athensensis]
MRRSKRLAAVTLSLTALLLLTGCWDIKNIQDMNYVTSIGFDYADNEYRVYVQMLDFISVAKVESGKPSQHVPVWVGTGKGATVIEAVNDLYQTSQVRVFYGQVSSIVVSERVMNKGLRDIQELQNRYYELRFTPWVFGTTMPIDKLFAVTPLFHLSPIISLLHQPMESYRQKSTITPITSREFITNYNEPDQVVLLPSIRATAERWKQDTSPHEVLDINGAFVYQDGQYQGWLSERKLIGLRWIDPKTSRSPLVVYRDGQPEAAVSLEAPKIQIRPIVKGNSAAYEVSVKLSGNISDIVRAIKETELEAEVAARVRNEIRETFVNGLQINSDLLQLQHTLYRTNNKEWKRLKREGNLKLMPDSLADIRVDVQLNNAGKLKYPAASR